MDSEEQALHSVGNGIQARPGSWTFSSLESQDFDDHISKSIPSYHALNQQAILLSSHFLRSDCLSYDIGCSTGQFLKLLHARYANRNARFVGLDCQSSMVSAAQSLLGNNDSISFVLADARDYSYDQASCIYSRFTLQFMSESDRQPLVDNLYKALEPGGAFFLYEKVIESDSRIHDIMSRAYTSFKLSSFTPSEIIAKSSSLDSVLKSYTREENFELLQSAGFSTTSLIHKSLSFEGYLAIK